MSKILAGTAFVLLSGATVTGGVLLSKGNKQTSDEPSKPEYDADIADTLDKFKTEAPKEKCITNLFETGVTLTEPSSNPNLAEADVNSNFLGQSTAGCLVVNWNKKTKSSDSKWKGTFRFLWAVRGDSKGFVVYILGTPTKDSSGSNHKLSWTGLAYLMQKDTSGNTWSVQKKADLNSNASFPSSENDNKKFPGAGEVLADVTGKDFWDFLSAASDLSNIAEDSELEGATESFMKGYWEWENGTYSGTSVSDKKKLTDWTKNVESWWSAMFSKDVFKDKTKTEIDKQYGTWTKRVYEVLPKTSSNGTGS